VSDGAPLATERDAERVTRSAVWHPRQFRFPVSSSQFPVLSSLRFGTGNWGYWNLGTGSWPRAALYNRRAEVVRVRFI